MKISKIPPYTDGLLNVIIETPRASQNKYAFEPVTKVFRLKKILPLGTTFPFDFGFIPNTIAEDGDPVDVLVIMDEPAQQGCMVTCRPIGILEAKQREIDGKTIRNDRLVAIADCSILYNGIQHISDLNKQMVEEIENFFIDYNKHEGKKFTPIKWANAKTALKQVRKGMNNARL